MSENLIGEGERLSQLGFSQEVSDRVAEIADRQRLLNSYSQLAAKLPPIGRLISPTQNPLDYIDFQPRDYDGVLLYHLPMANSLDANMLTRVSVMAEAEPNKRIIAISNPGSPGHQSGLLKFREAVSVWRGRMRPVVETTLRLLEKENIDQINQAGFSFGADRAAALAQFAEGYVEVDTNVLMEPAGVVRRGINKLARDFVESGSYLDDYINQTNSTAYYQARTQADKEGHGLIGYGLGLVRITNIAIAHALSRDGFQGRVAEAMQRQSAMNTSIFWGSQSEIAIDGCMKAVSNALIDQFSSDRVKVHRLVDQRHAMGDDIFLHAAMVLEGQRDFQAG